MRSNMKKLLKIFLIVCLFLIIYGKVRILIDKKLEDKNIEKNWSDIDTAMSE